jgi:hypothetical protein
MAPVAVEPPAGGRFCPKREGIGGYYGKFFQSGGIVGIFINLNGSLVKNSTFVCSSSVLDLFSEYSN